jgi:hypothetical protein
MTTNEGWGLARRIGFRFGFLVAVLEVFPFPIGSILGTGWLSTQLNKPLTWAINGFADLAFGLPAMPTTRNGSGDTTYDYVWQLLIMITAAIGTTIWSVADRRRASYPLLAALLRIELRYVVASAMLIYGYVKIIKSQFPDLPPTWLYQRVGDNSPMRMLWAFMGYSLPYTVFAGLIEATGGALLLWRRTATLGAMVVCAVMTNVVLLNFCYDVPVKLYSAQLLIMALAVGAPGVRRVIAAALGHATAAVPPRVRMSRSREIARLVLKLAVVGSLAYGVYQEGTGPNRNDHRHELYGVWIVDTFAIDGTELPPLAGDPVRWQAWTANPRSSSVWFMSGRREVPATIQVPGYTTEVDSAAHTIKVTVDDKTEAKETWTYARPAPDRLVIDAPHFGKKLHVALHREPAPPLLTRGFHWINEVPFNR